MMKKTHNLFKTLLFLIFFAGCNTDTQQKRQFFLRANEAIAIGEYQEAIRFYNEALELDTTFSEAYNNRGIAYFELGQFERAVEDYTKAIATQPEYTDAYYNRANAFYEMKEYEKSKQDLNWAQKSYADSAYIYFTRGIMAHFNNEAEFAGVLGHEIGHIAARHSAKQYSKAMMAELGLAVGSVLSEEFAQFSDLARTGVGILFLKFGRNAERQSDKLGVEYSTKTGYDAHEMANFFNTLQRMKPDDAQEVPSFLSTHPHPQDRYERVRELATKWQQKLNLSNPELEVNRDNYLKMIDGLIYGEDPRQGFVENNVFYHPEMRFLFPYPKGWILQNTRQQVQMAPENGQALMIFTLAQANSLNNAASAVLERYNLQALDSKKTTVNGFNAYIIVAEQKLQQNALRLLIYLIEDQNRIYNFMGVSEPANFNNYYQLFSNSMQNFKRLTDQEKLNVQPDRIEIVEAGQTGSLSTILRRLNVKKSRFEEIALLNGMDLQQTIQKGTLLKVIENQ